MYYGKMWLVVKPSVGLPLFFGAIATASLLIHAAVLTHTTWYPAFYQGKVKSAVASAESPAAVVNVGGGAPASSVVVNVGGAK